MIKLFISDLDGTLLHGEDFTSVEVGSMVLGKEIKDAVADLQASGIDFAVATGRYVNDIMAIEEVLNLKGDHYRIALNGAFIYHGDEKIAEYPIDAKTALSLMDILKTKYAKKSHFYNIYFEFGEKYLFPFKWYIRLFLPFFLKRMHAQRWNEEIKKSLMYDNRPSFKFLVGVHEKSLVATQAALEQQYPNLSMFASSPRSIEICAAGVDKGMAIKQVMARLGLKPEEVAFIGDSGNDVSGFQVVGHSFVMSHGHKRYKEHAVHEVKNVAEAIAQVIEMNRQELQQQ